MSLIADYGITGADQFVSKTKMMTSSVKALDGAWNKYNKSIAASSNMKSMMGGGGKGGGSIIQSLVAFSIVGKVMEKMMGDTLKNWFAKLVKSDVEKYKNIGKGLAKFLKPVTDNLRANMKLVADGARTIGRDIYGGGRYLGRRGRLLGRMAGRRASAAGSAAKALYNKAPAAMRLAVIEGTIIAKVAGRMLGPLIRSAFTIVTKTPVSMLVTAPLLLAGLDSRLQDIINKKIEWVVNKISGILSATADGIGSMWSGFKVGLARVTNNPYYADSQVSWAGAAKAQTPEQQKAFMESEKKRLTEADLEEFVRVEMKRMTKFFLEENEKRSREIGRVQDLMVKQGRL